MNSYLLRSGPRQVLVKPSMQIVVAAICDRLAVSGAKHLISRFCGRATSAIEVFDKLPHQQRRDWMPFIYPTLVVE
nr:hypothetical protein [Nocardia amamiensis]